MATVTRISDWLSQRDASRIMVRAGMTPDPWQRQLLRRRPHRALVVTSRQAGKSSVAAAKSLHRAANTPRSTIVAVSPTQRQSALLVSKVKRFAESMALPLTKANVLSVELENESIIHALPGSPDTVRGYSPDLLVIDEAAYTSESLYTAVLPSLAATNGDLVCITTPNGKQGWFWAEWSGAGADGWMRIEVPYTEISRITKEFIAGQKASMSSERFSTEYECKFHSSTYGLFNPADLAAALQKEPISAAGLPDAREIMRRNRERYASGVA